jgi:hypothetical protein
MRHKPGVRSISSRIFWVIMAAAITLAIAAGAVGFSLRHQHPVPDMKVYFVFCAGLFAVVLLLIAQVYQQYFQSPFHPYLPALASVMIEFWSRQCRTGLRFAF